MIAVALPEVEMPVDGLASYRYLLLGELRMLLEDPAPDDVTRLWLLAVLDRLLASLPRQSVRVDSAMRGDHRELLPTVRVPSSAMQKLQRLRDRVAHRSPFQILANEIRSDLKQWFDQSLSPLHDGP